MALFAARRQPPDDASSFLIMPYILEILALFRHFSTLMGPPVQSLRIPTLRVVPSLTAIADALRPDCQRADLPFSVSDTLDHLCAPEPAFSEILPRQPRSAQILQPIRSSNSRSRLPRDQRSTTESTEMHGKENPNQLPLSVSFPGATPARRVGSLRGYPFVMIFLAVVIAIPPGAAHHGRNGFAGNARSLGDADYRNRRACP